MYCVLCLKKGDTSLQTVCSVKKCLGNYLKTKLIGTRRRVVGNKLEKIVYSYIRECIERRFSCERRCIPGKCNPHRYTLRRHRKYSRLFREFSYGKFISPLENVDLRRLPSCVITICLLPLTTNLQTYFFSEIKYIICS